ncbi:MAG: hypothetical protein J0L73_00155 [Verrucomicrobia bacterium]|nr:hypothetical protein [Verrucomicrobiota bacterium]
MNSSPYPILVLALLGLVASLITLVTVFRVRRVALKLLLLLISLLALAPTGLVLVTMFPEWVDARFRSYKTFYEGIQPGMTKAEIMAWEAQIYPEGGPRQRPQIIVEDETSLSFFMHPEHSTDPNCEGILLVFENGKLKAKTYSPD